MAETYAPLLEMVDIEKQFPGVKALDHAQLTLRAGTVHALMGENGAGKSTLMKCLFGIYKKDAGVIKVDGEEVNFSGPHDALSHGVAMVHQELNQVLRRNVMENVWLGRIPVRYGLVNTRKMYADTRAIFEDLQIDVDPRTRIGALSVSRRQMVEIAKAVSYNAKILVLDEPTSSLTENEVEHLFRIMKRLTEKGVGIIYISHKMDEILRIADDVTIMRDGQWVATRPANELDTDEIIRLMVNRDMSHRFPPKTNQPGEVLMEVKNLSGKYEPTFHDVSFPLRAGEVLGVSGLVGSRRTELVNAIFGYYTKAGGEILLRGKPISNRKPIESSRNGFALLTEERRATGIFRILDVRSNTVISCLKKCRADKLPQLSNRKMQQKTQWSVDRMRIKTPSLSTKIRALSGGNQQKVIIGRWLLTEPEIFLMDEPTRGIDVGAKYEIYQIIIDMAREGKSIVMVSSEMPELLGVCDRILVMSNGRLAGEVDTASTTQEEIMTLAAKYM